MSDTVTITRGSAVLEEAIDVFDELILTYPQGDKAAAAYLAEMMQNPAKLLEHQVGHWGKSLKHYLEAQQKLAAGKFEAPDDPGPKDKRFANPLWDTNPYFNFLKQQRCCL